LNRSGLILLGVTLTGLLGSVHPAAAQVQNISIVSGQGQLIFPASGFLFQALVVKVTDANGVPQQGVQVNWTLTQGAFGAQFLTSGTTTTSTFTGGDGIANAFLQTQPQFGSVFQQFVLNNVTATTTSASVTFNLYQAASDTTQLGGAFPVNAQAWNPALQDLYAGGKLTGQAGSTSSNPLQVRVVGTGGGVLPGVSVQLVSVKTGCDATDCQVQDPSTGPTVNCATGAGAPANTVLTDALGIATCTPVLGGVPGTGQFIVLIGFGGAVPDSTKLTAIQIISNVILSRPLNLTVTPAPAGTIKTVSGDTFNVNPGQTQSLTAEVDTPAGAPVAGQTVNWAITQGTGSLTNASTVTDVNGRVSNTVTVSSQASGVMRVTATLAGDTSKSVTYTINVAPPVTVTGLSIVSGNNQSAIVNTAFSQALVVQVTQSNGQPASGVFVQFSVNGPASLSANGATTDSNGRAQVNVTAGGTTGSVSVTASAAGFAQTFNLSVSPPGPDINAQSFVNAADFQNGSISPCSLAAVVGSGLAPGIQGVVVPTTVGPWAYTVANDRITVGTSQAPIYAVSNVNGREQVVFQVPCDVAPGNTQVTVNVGAGSRAVTVNILAASPGVFQYAMSDGQSRAVMVRPDGSFVSLENPARRGENVVVFVTGLGPTNPAVGTNQVAPPGSTATVRGAVVPGINAGGADLVSAVLSPDLLGVYEVTFTIPGNTPAGSNVGFSIGVVPSGSSQAFYSNLVRIPVQ